VSLPVVFRGLADREVHEIQAWYEARQAGLGGRFRASLELVVQLISEHPLACLWLIATPGARLSLAFRTRCSTSSFLTAFGFWPVCISIAGQRPSGKRSPVGGG